MRRLVLPALVLTVTAAAAAVQARGLAYRGNGGRTTRVMRDAASASRRRTSTANFNRAARAGYRRPPTTVRRRGRTPEIDPGQSTLQRGLASFGSGDFRNGLVIGAGRWNARRYDSPRDRRVAGATGRRVAGTLSRVGSGIRRLISP